VNLTILLLTQVPSPSLGVKEENYTNKTMDEILILYILNFCSVEIK